MKEGLLSPYEAIMAIEEDEKKAQKKTQSTALPLPSPAVSAGRSALGLPAVGSGVKSHVSGPRVLPTGREKEDLRAEVRARSRTPGSIDTSQLSPKTLPTFSNGRMNFGENRKSSYELPTGLERVGYGMQSVGQTAAASVPLLLETGKQYFDNNEAEVKNPQSIEIKKKISQLAGQIDYLERYAYPTRAAARKSAEWQELRRKRDALNKELEGLEVNTALSKDTFGMKLMGKALESEEKALEGLSPSQRFLGSTALSIGQNAALLPAAAINPAIPLATMGTMAAARKTYELNERGETPESALLRGIASGAIEAATEKIPMDTVLDLVKTGGKGAIKNILKQAGVEATEEGISYAANYLADKAAKDPQAEFSAAELVQSAAAGGLSGLFFGGAGTAINKAIGKPLPAPGKETAEGTTQAEKQEEGPRLLPTGMEDRKGWLPRGNEKTASTEETEQLLLPEQSELSRKRGYPVRKSGAVYKVVEIPQAKVDEIAAYIDAMDTSSARKKFKRILKNLFMGQKIQNVNTVANQVAYEIGMSSRGIGEIIARQPVSAETMAAMEQLNEIVENAKYVASEPSSHTQRRGITRTDIFEAGTKIGDRSGLAKFRVNVGKDGNNLYFATHKITEGDAPQPWADKSRHHGVEELPPVNDSTITQSDSGVNTQDSQNKGEVFGGKLLPDPGKETAGTTQAAEPEKQGEDPLLLPAPGKETAETVQRGKKEQGPLGLPTGMENRKGWLPRGDEKNWKSLMDENEPQPDGPKKLFTAEEWAKTKEAEKSTPEGKQDEAYWDSVLQDEPEPKDETKVEGYWDGLLDWVDAKVGAAEDRSAEVQTERNPLKQSAREQADEAWSYFKRKMVDAGDSVTRVSKIVGDKFLYPYYNFARASSNAAENMIAPKGAQTDITGNRVGQSLADLWDPIREKGQEYYKAFEEYLFHKHNVDRMSIDRASEANAAEQRRLDFLNEHPEYGFETEDRLRRIVALEGPDAPIAADYLGLVEAANRADRAKNKPVFDWEVTADQSREKAARYERDYPEFKELAEQVYQYSRNLMQYRVDSGLLTMEQADTIERIYPHYVPTYRESEAPTLARDKKNVRVGKTVKRAEGGNATLMPIHVAMARQTMQVVREGSKNRFGLRLLQDMQEGKNDVSRFVRNAEETDRGFSADTFDNLEDLTPQLENTFTVYRDGKQVAMQLDPGLYDGVQVLSQSPTENNVLVKSVRAANNLFKKLVTGYNPMFTARNFARDLQDAGLYSKDLPAFAENYPMAVKEIATNGPYWQQYKALGGTYSSIFDYEQGYTQAKEEKRMKRAVGKRIEAANMAVEQAPRLAEFMATVKKGDGSMDNLMEAMHNAADVTVNFGRGGTLGKTLNQNFVPFLNPGIQGFDKMVRRITETKGGKEWAKLAVRAAALGIAPAVLNTLLYKDDEDWENIRDSDKDVSYLFKLGDGYWMKIPKGRTLSLFGMVGSRALGLLRGDEVDWPGVIKTAANQVAPANPLQNNILAAWVDADLTDSESPGKTWYGADIESQRLQKYSPGQRYDENTDYFSKWLGGALNLSPKKVHYLLDQYSGVVGDFTLPLITPSGNKNPMAPFKSAFVLDSVSSNKISGEFYDTADEITYAKSEGKPGMSAVNRFWNKQADAVSDIYAHIREVETDKDMTNEEKLEAVRQAKAVLNAIQKNALEALPDYEKAVEKYYTGDSEEEMDKTYREANREVFGARYALEAYNKDVYMDARRMEYGGISYNKFYDAYFGLKAAKGSGEGQSERQREALLNMEGISKEEKTAFGVTIIGDSRELDYSSPAALEISLMSESGRKDAAKAEEAGIDGEAFLKAYNAQKGIKGDKDRSGKTIPLSASANKKEAIDRAAQGLSEQQRRKLYELFDISRKVWWYQTDIQGQEEDTEPRGLPTGLGSSQQEGPRLLPTAPDVARYMLKK